MNINKIIKILTVSIFILVSGIFFWGNAKSQTESSEHIISEKIEPQESEIIIEPSLDVVANHIFVHVCGAVKRPGVYELDEGARVCDAINAASGFKKKADDTKINQAQLLTDGEQIVVPYCSSNREDFSEQDGTRVSINYGTIEEFMTLPGIGQSKAESIIKYREEHGLFKNIEELKNIQGIKDGVFSNIEDYIML